MVWPFGAGDLPAKARPEGLRAHEQQSASGRARTGSSAPLTSSELAPDRQHILGDMAPIWIRINPSA
jgi:hypothetical protein